MRSKRHSDGEYKFLGSKRYGDWKLYRSLKLICLSILVMCIFTGCMVQNDRKISEITNYTKLSLSWWGNDARHLYTLEGIRLFEGKFTDVDVECNYAEWSGFETRMNLELASHTQSDVMQVNFGWIYEYSGEKQSFYDLNKLSDYIDLSTFSEDELSYGTVDGTLVALPTAMNMQILYLNKSIYDRYNLELPKTWEDWFEVAKVLREDGIYPIGMQVNQVLTILVAYSEQVTGKRFIDTDGKIGYDEEDIKIMLAFYKRLIDEKVIPHIEDFEKSKIIDGTFAGSGAWISDGADYWDVVINAGADVQIGDFPLLEDAKRKGWYVKPASLYTISAYTSHPEEAAELLNFLVNDKDMALLQGTEKGVPVSKSAVEALEDAGRLSGIQYEANKKMLEYADSVELLSPFFENSSMIAEFKAEADVYLYDKETLEECALNIYKIFMSYSR